MSINPLIDEILETKEELWNQVVREMKLSISQLFVTRAYITIIDAMGTIHFIEPEFDQYLFFIQNYILDNLKNLKVGDVTVPFGGISLAFFKVSPKAIIVLHSKGPSGQLLAFKKVMHKWAERIDKLIGDLEVSKPAYTIPKPPPETIELFWQEEIEADKKRTEKIKRIPVLTKKLTGKEKFNLQVIKFIQLCNGMNTIEDISRKTNTARLKVDLIIRDLIKKKVIKLKRSLR